MKNSINLILLAGGIFLTTFAVPSLISTSYFQSLGASENFADFLYFIISFSIYITIFGFLIYVGIKITKAVQRVESRFNMELDFNELLGEQNPKKTNLDKGEPVETKKNK